jgi:transglutaminase-like putative cysteine protease
MKKLHIYFIWFCTFFILNISMQITLGQSEDNDEYYFYQKGTVDISGMTYKENYTLCFNKVVYSFSLKGITIPTYMSDSTIGNTISFQNPPVLTADSGVTFSDFYLMTDANGIPHYEFTLLVPDDYNFDQVTFHMVYPNISTNLDMALPFNGIYAYPITKTLSQDIKTYLNPTTRILSKDANTDTIAKHIASGKTNLIDVIDTLAKWVESNINIDNDNGYRWSDSVLNYKTTQCEGSANLLAAFCRSLGIPARVCSGQIIEKEIGITLPTGFTPNPYKQYSGANGTIPSPHACCEVYFPELGG